MIDIKDNIRSIITGDGSRLLSIALSRGGDFADLFIESTVSRTISMEDGDVKNIANSRRVGAGIRTVKDELTGYSSSEIVLPEVLEKAALNAAAAMNEKPGKSRKDINLTWKEHPLYYEKVEGREDLSTKIELLKRLDSAARNFCKEIKKVEVSLIEVDKTVWITSSDGTYVEDIRPMMTCKIQVIAERNGKRESGSSGGGGRIGIEYLTDERIARLGSEASSEAVHLLDAHPAPAGEQVVILGSGDAGVLLHEAIGHGLEADFNRKKTSNYSDRIGEKVASGLCTVIDDGTIEKNRGSINVDDEGTDSERTVLIEKGILKTYLTDKLNAGLMNLPLTGNGRRESFSHIVLPRMRVTYLAAGESDPEEIISSVKKGIYATGFAGGQVDISNGDFVFVTKGTFLIEDGRLTAPLKGATLIGNGPQILERITEVGSDLVISDGKWTCGKDGQSVPVGVGTPTLKISSITVGGTDVG